MPIPSRNLDETNDNPPSVFEASGAALRACRLRVESRLREQTLFFVTAALLAAIVRRRRRCVSVGALAM
jgi:hypothetical protein